MTDAAITTGHCQDDHLIGVAEAAVAMGIARSTMQTWILRGCPYLQKGNRPIPWIFSKKALSKWRDANGLKVGYDRRPWRE